MRKLIWLAVLAALLWSSYWYVGARGIDQGLTVWLDDRRTEGWQADVSTVRTAGFPFEVETILTGIDLVDPETGLGWSAPSFRFTAPLHAPTRIRAVWPDSQHIVTPFETIEVTAGTMHADLGLIPGPALELNTADIAITDLNLLSSQGWQAALERGSLKAQRLDTRPNAYDTILAARNLTPSQPLLRRLNMTGSIPETIAAMDLEVSVDFDAPWDRDAIEVRRPQPTAIDLGGVKIRWGDMQFEAAGDVTVSPEGIPDGRIVVRAVNWREMLSIAQSSELLPESLLPPVERGLEVLAGLSGGSETIDAPLTFQNGLVKIGPIPLGPAPLIRLR